MKKTKILQTNLRYVFSYACVKVSVDDELYSMHDKKKIQEIVMQASKHIEIDKTYADYDGTKYKKTFMTNKGWNALTELVISTKYGKKCTKEQNDTLFESYSLMILCYLYQLLEDFDYDISAIHLELKDRTMFMVQIYIDNTDVVSSYQGKWQSW